MRQSLILASLLVLATPAVAEDGISDAPKGAGRFAIQSSDGGFIRLDTETGAVSHCKRTNETWRCDAIAEDEAALQAQMKSLSDQVTALAGEVAGLKNEIASLKAAPTLPKTELTPEEEHEFDKAMSFAERLMKRFFEMVRDLKGDERQSI
jgi:hypothetical protein